MKFLSMFCMAVGLTVTSAQALDLTPKFVARGSDQIPYYVEDGVKYTLNITSEITVTADEGGTSFCFRELDGATLVMKAAPLPPSLPAKDGGKDAYMEAVRKALTPGAEEALIQEGNIDGLSLPNKEALGFLQTYKLPGRRFSQAVVFIKYNDQQQIMLVLTAPASSFDEALSRARRILRSWRKVNPEEDLSLAPAS